MELESSEQYSIGYREGYNQGRKAVVNEMRACFTYTMILLGALALAIAIGWGCVQLINMGRLL